jgi:DNA polymerase III subunit delta'
MILLKDVRGQSNAVRYLAGSLSSGRAASSYLFTGPRGVGRALTAKAFIAEMACSSSGACGICRDCRRIDSVEHPDVLWIKPEKNRAIKIEQVRAARDTLSFKPYELPFGVCVIEDAHLMTTEAANALLKVLEEPPGGALIVLITDKKELLPSTVVSRCAEVRFCSLTAGDTESIIAERSDVDGSTARFLAQFSQGSPGTALEMIGEEVLARKDALMRMVEEAAGEENPFLMSWDTEDRNVLLGDIEMLIMSLRDIMMGKEGMEERMLDRSLSGTSAYRVFEGCFADRVYHMVEKLVAMKLALEGNMNPKLAAQALPGIFN